MALSNMNFQTVLLDILTYTTTLDQSELESNSNEDVNYTWTWSLTIKYTLVLYSRQNLYLSTARLFFKLLKHNRKQDIDAEDLCCELIQKSEIFMV